MSDTRMKLEVLLAGVDKLTRPLRDAMAGSKELAQAVKHSREQLKALERTQGQMASFNRLREQSKASTEAMRKSNEALDKHRRALGLAQTERTATAAKLKAAQKSYDNLNHALIKFPNLAGNFTAAIAKQKFELEALQHKHNLQTNAIRRAKDAIQKESVTLKENTANRQRLAQELVKSRQLLGNAGIKVGQLARHEDQLKSSVAGVTASLEKQQAALEKVSRHQQRLNDIRGRYGRAKEVRDKVAGGGMATMGAGAVVAAPMVKTVADYSRFEDAMLGVAKQVDGTRDDNGRLTKTYYEMGDAIKAMGERIPMATTEIAALVEGGARMGIQGKDNLLIFAETAAKAATAFDMPADQLSEDMGKIANIYKIPIKNIEQLGDVINYLDDNAQSKGGDIINVMQRIAGNVGSMDYKQAAALASTFLTLGAGPEVAATATKAMVRELQIASEQPARFRKGLKELGLDAKQLEQQMARDSTGTIMKVLEAVQKLPDTKRMGVMVRLFGKEYGDDAAKLADNLGEYRKQLELVNSAKAKGSMQREADAKKDTLSAQWQMTRNRLFNQSSALGATLKPALVEIMSAAAKVLERFSAWTKANPQLVATLMKIAAVVAVVLTALGGLMLMVAATLGPLALARMSVSTLFAGLGSGAGILGRIGPAFGVLARLVTSGAGAVGKLARVLLWLPRIFPIISAAMASTPIGWVLLGLTAIALLVYKFWGPLKGFFVGFFGGLAQGVASVLGPALSALWQTLQTLWGAIKEFGGYLATLFPFLAPLGMVIMAAFEPIKNLIAWLWDGFTNLMKPIEDTGGAAQSMGQKIGAAVGQAIGGLLSLPVKAYQIGADMVTGLISGINKMLGSLKAAILGVGDMLPEWLRNKLDIHSPSRVFAGIGGYTMAGLEQGIVKNQDGPLAALRSATGKLTALGAGLMLGSGPALAGQLDTRPPLARPAMAAAAPIMINAPITIHAAPGMDERALARVVRQELEKAQRDAQARQRSKFGDID